MKSLFVIVVFFLFSQFHTYGQLLETNEILARKQLSFDAQFFNNETQLALRLRKSIEVYEVNPAVKSYNLEINSTALATASHSNMLIAATSDGKVFFYSGDSLTMVLNAGDTPVKEIELFETLGYVAFWTNKTEVSIWSIDDSSKLQALPTEGEIVTDMVFSQDGTHLLLGTNEGRIIDWDLNSGKNTEKSKVHKGFVRGLAIHPDGDRFASCGDDGLIAIHSLSDNDYYMLEKSHSNFIMDVEFLNENLLLGIGHDHMISLNNINSLPDSSSVKNYFYLARHDTFAGDKYPGTLSVSNSNQLIGISTLGKGVILSSHFHDFINCSHKLKLGVNYKYSIPDYGADNVYESSMTACNIGGVLNRPEGVRDMCLVDHFHGTRHKLEIQSNGGFSIDVKLNQKHNRFDLIIVDFDDKLLPVKYSMQIERL